MISDDVHDSLIQWLINSVFQVLCELMPTFLNEFWEYMNEFRSINILRSLYIRTRTHSPPFLFLRSSFQRFFISVIWESVTIRNRRSNSVGGFTLLICFDLLTRLFIADLSVARFRFLAALVEGAALRCPVR